MRDKSSSNSTLLHHPESKNLTTNSTVLKRGESSRESNKQMQSATTMIKRAEEDDEKTGRERLKRHRLEVADRVWVPELWGQEDFLKDWIDCSPFDAAVMSSSAATAARASLAEQGRNKSNPNRLGIKNV
ncbi:protein BIC1-like [Andrographis paniculata]|uniref:protein BIC1-like n=1 Tax=Andrographis paniculata TaxID=175694 RepID=UPI0021E9628F|nr:protein BIC1-like [Andrographis paniculata]